MRITREFDGWFRFEKMASQLAAQFRADALHISSAALRARDSASIRCSSP